MLTAVKMAAWLLQPALGWLRPGLWESAWHRVELALARLARRRTLCWMGMALAVLLARAALLPVWPIPKPVVYDEFGYLLQADTFALGRLTNPPHPLWPFFESIYILQQPTYSTKFPPGQGLAMALGQRLFGHPWFGVWLSGGALMAALCWSLQGWLPPPWALLGAFLGLRLCLFSYWMESYWGGAVAAIGGALVLGAWPRIVRQGRTHFAWVLGLGLVILANTRPYEGLLFALPMAGALAFRARSARVWAPVAAVLAAGCAFILLYNQRVTGHALRFPYAEHNRQYGYVPPFNFLPLAPEKTYRHASIFNLYHQWEFERWQRSRTWHLVPDRATDWYTTVVTLTGGPVLALVLVALAAWTLRDRRLRLPVAAVGVVAIGSLGQIVYYTHYAAPAAAAFLLILAQSFRHLRQVRVRGRPVGRFLSRAIPAVAFVLLAASEGTRIWRQESPEQTMPSNARRDRIEEELGALPPGRHVIIVRYTGTQNPHEEWVYNRADIDASAVVWAHDMGPKEDGRLVAYFKDRAVWLFEPDRDPDRLDRYTGQ